MTQQHILIFAKTPYEKTPYDEWLQDTGIQPILLVAEECAAGYRHLPQVFSFSGYDNNQLVEKTALDIGRRNSLVGVFARAEADILRAARLRELLALPGQDTASALAFRNKVVMKDHLRQAGAVLLPHYRSLDSAYDLLSFVEEHGFPVVVKPVAESGSLGTQILRDESELARFLAHPYPGELMVETFVAGHMHHVDGLVLNGELQFIHPFQYVNDCLSFRKNEFLGSATISADNPSHKPLLEATYKVLAALPTPPHMAFHAEFWRTPDGSTVFCEIASRTGGGMVSATIKQAFGFDIDREWLLAECGQARALPVTPQYRPAGAVWMPPLNGVLESLPAGGEPDYVRARQISGAPGQRFHGGVKSGLFLAGYVVDGESDAVVVSNMISMAGWFAKETRWGPAS